ncbi:MAG: YciI family protein [Oricola sp.]
MFVVSLTYKVPLDRIDAAAAEHMAFLDRHYAAGHFLVSGRKIPRTGGVIVADGVDRETLDRILAEDPFHRDGLADYEVIEFSAMKARDDIGAALGIGS